MKMVLLSGLLAQAMRLCTSAMRASVLNFSKVDMSVW
jgi:hypothetical protein